MDRLVQRERVTQFLGEGTHPASAPKIIVGRGPMESILQRLLPRWVVIASCLSVLLFLQFEMTHDKLTRPFLDGSLHYDYDNADFTFKARNGIRVGEARSQLGLTVVPYSSWGKSSGEPAFYTHHPFLMKALFQLSVRAIGDSEWVSRTFALCVSALAASGVFVALLMASGCVLASLIGTAVLVNIPVFATYQVCLKYEIDGMAIGIWFFVAVSLYLRSPSRVRLAAVAILAILSALAHWTALLFVASVFAWLLWERVRRHDHVSGAAAFAAAVGASIGCTGVVATFVLLNGGWSRFFADLASAASTRSDITALQRGAWTERQVQYLIMNFGEFLLWVTVFFTVTLGILWARQRLSGTYRPAENATGRLLPSFFFCTLSAACIWQFAFRQGSFVHVYWQLWFCIPVAALLAAAVAASQGRRLVYIATVLFWIMLIAHLNLSSRTAYEELFRLQRGTPQDVAFLRSLRGDVFSRFVFIPVEDIAFNGWFSGPVFEYY